MICEYCNKEHDGSYGSGRFCSNTCARGFASRDKREEINKKVSLKLKGRPKEKNIISKKKKYPKRIKKCVCIVCNKEFTTDRLRKYCSNKCHQAQVYKDYIDRWKNGLEDGNKGSCSISGYIRRYLFKKYDNKCCKCGWAGINPVTKNIPLEVNHIDGNSENNKEENLELICPNCHSLTPNHGSLNMGNGRRYYREHKRKISKGQTGEMVNPA